MKHVQKTLLGGCLIITAQLALSTNISAKHLPTFTCPAISALVKSTKQHWGTHNGNFRSTDVSFANKIKSFRGAIWKGIVLGHIACVYQPNNTQLFPIILQFSKLAYAPTSGHWKSTSKKHNSNYVCVSLQQKNCQFTTRAPSATSNIMQVVQNLYQGPSTNDTPAF